MLVDGAVKYAKIGRQAILDKDIKKAHEYLVRTQDIFIELMATLDVNSAGDWGKNLRAIYEFINYKLVQANLKKDINIIDEVLPVIEDVRDTWYKAYELSKR
jgi:flagellar protein FliS